MHNPSADVGLKEIVARIPASDLESHFDSKLILVPATGLADAAIFLLQLQGKTVNTDTSCTLVCDIIGGASFAEDKLAKDLTSVTLEVVAQVYTASTWLLGKARDARHFTALKPGASASATSGKEAAAAAAASVSPATLGPHVRAQDLDSRDWGDKCADKKGVRVKLDILQSLTRIWSTARMIRYCSELVLNQERLETTCRNLKSTGKHPGITTDAADDTEHPDYGLDKFCILQSMAVIWADLDRVHASKFSTDINTQEKNDLLPDLVLSSSEAIGHLLETYGTMFISDASTLSNRGRLTDTRSTTRRTWGSKPTSYTAFWAPHLLRLPLPLLH
ncbi:hypothetical protein B484DRAFT_400415 [Ochromonadaceae sp. CCMP2298]|nr:hypothetical protein B484DRAFT_400415 [Ochromonadaceae sp. CCMP2298]